MSWGDLYTVIYIVMYQGIVCEIMRVGVGGFDEWCVFKSISPNQSIWLHVSQDSSLILGFYFDFQCDRLTGSEKAGRNPDFWRIILTLEKCLTFWRNA